MYSHNNYKYVYFSLFISLTVKTSAEVSEEIISLSHILYESYERPTLTHKPVSVEQNDNNDNKIY